MNNKLSSYVFYALAALSIIVFGLYLMGGSAEVTYNGENYDAPNNTDLLLYWLYALLGIVVVVTCVSAVTSFITKLTTDKRSAYTSLVMTAALLILCGITYAIGSDEPLNLIGYDGSENQGGYLKMADMCLYSIYTLIFGACIAALLNSFAKKF